KVSRVIDQHVDSPELLYRSLDRGLRIPWLRHVELYDQQIVRSPDHLRHLLDIPPRRDRLISRRQSRLRNVGPHAPPGTSNQQYSSFLSRIAFSLYSTHTPSRPSRVVKSLLLFRTRS